MCLEVVAGISMSFYTGDVGVRRERRLHSLAKTIARPFLDAWQCRELVRVIVWRELSQRFSQSYFGWFWAVLSPLTLLGIYTFVFSKVVDIRGSTENYALSIFVGLILFNLFAELAHRAPMLLPEHAQFIKKSICPLEVLGWTSLLRALSYAGIGLAVFFIFQLVLTGRIQLTAARRFGRVHARCGILDNHRDPPAYARIADILCGRGRPRRD
jgi:hypothetical protein